MSHKRLPLTEPLVQDMLRFRALNVRKLSLLLLGVGVAVLVSQVSCNSVGEQRLAIWKPAAKMFWNPMEASMIIHHEEEPFEPFRHFLYQAKIPEGEKTDNFNLWPQHVPTTVPRQEEAYFNFFPGRDPFKDISMETDLPAGHYISRSFTSQAHVGPDGKLVTERYASSAAGNGKEGIHEAKHLYSNSSSGLAKASHEQHLRGRSRMAVTEYGDGKTSASNQIFHGMNETENEAFGQEFERNTKHLPDRAKLSRDALDAPSHNFEGWAPLLGYGNRR